jgi:hypothetical protein
MPCPANITRLGAPLSFFVSKNKNDLDFQELQAQDRYQGTSADLAEGRGKAWLVVKACCHGKTCLC